MPSVCLPTAVGVGTGALGHGEHQLALLRLTGGEHGNLHGLASGVEVGGDLEKVLSGGGHVLGVVDVAIVGTNGEEGKALRQYLGRHRGAPRRPRRPPPRLLGDSPATPHRWRWRWHHPLHPERH